MKQNSAIILIIAIALGVIAWYFWMPKPLLESGPVPFKTTELPGTEPKR